MVDSSSSPPLFLGEAAQRKDFCPGLPDERTIGCGFAQQGWNSEAPCLGRWDRNKLPSHPALQSDPQRRRRPFRPFCFESAFGHPRVVLHRLSYGVNQKLHFSPHSMVVPKKRIMSRNRVTTQIHSLLLLYDPVAGGLGDFSWYVPCGRRQEHTWPGRTGKGPRGDVRVSEDSLAPRRHSDAKRRRLESMARSRGRWELFWMRELVCGSRTESRSMSRGPYMVWAGADITLWAGIHGLSGSL